MTMAIHGKAYEYQSYHILRIAPRKTILIKHDHRTNDPPNTETAKTFVFRILQFVISDLGKGGTSLNQPDGQWNIGGPG
jgi:hypothetical protein